MKIIKKLTTIVCLTLFILICTIFIITWINTTPYERANEDSTEFFGTLIFLEPVGNGMSRTVAFVVEEDFASEFIISHTAIWSVDPMDVLHLGQTVYFRVFYSPINENQTRITTNITSLRTDAGYIFTLDDYNQHIARLNRLFAIEAMGMILIFLALFVHCVFVLRGKNIFNKIAEKLSSGGSIKTASLVLGIIALVLIGAAITAFVLVSQSDTLTPTHRTFALWITLPGIFAGGILYSIFKLNATDKKSYISSKKGIKSVILAILVVAIGITAFFLFRNLDSDSNNNDPVNDVPPVNDVQAPPPYITLGGQPISTDIGELNIDLTANDDIAQLAYLQHLERLSLSNFAGDIEDPIALMNALSQLTNLRELDLTLIPIYHLEPIANLTNLERLNIHGSFLPDITPLSRLTNLTTLDLIEVGVRDISPLANLENLESLVISHNEITDISPVAGLVKLETLILSFNSELANISDLSNMENLQRLELRGTNISDLSSLAELYNLERLDLEDANISDITLLSAVTNLTELFLGNNSVVDISPIEGLELSQLWLQNNLVADVTPLAEMFSLRMLELGGNPVTDLSPLEHLYETVINPMSGNSINS